jgi:hypothetical protein
MNETLRAELLRMREDDLSTRRRLIEAGQLYGPHLPRDWYHPEMEMVHRKNNARLREIIAEYGFPARSLVGDDGCDAAWQIAQHAILDIELQELVLPMLKKAADEGDAPAQHYAMLTDSVLFRKGELQIYGSIFVGGENGLVPAPIADPEHVDERRAAMGLMPLREHMAKLQQRVDVESKVQSDANGDKEN